jgi:hypothetical protein
VLEHVVQDRGGDNVIRVALAVDQRGDFDWMRDERGAVGLAPLTSVLSNGPDDRRLRKREVEEGAERALGLGHDENVTPRSRRNER